MFSLAFALSLSALPDFFSALAYSVRSFPEEILMYNYFVLGSSLIGCLALAVAIFHPTRPFLTGHARTAKLWAYSLYLLVVVVFVLPEQDFWHKTGLWVLANLFLITAQLGIYRVLTGRFSHSLRSPTRQNS
jgi:hypothetical protein